jgi:hypothetical protein
LGEQAERVKHVGGTAVQMVMVRMKDFLSTPPTLAMADEQTRGKKEKERTKKEGKPNNAIAPTFQTVQPTPRNPDQKGSVAPMVLARR